MGDDGGMGGLREKESTRDSVSQRALT
jgi:hypothetical protein